MRGRVFLLLVTLTVTEHINFCRVSYVVCLMSYVYVCTCVRVYVCTCVRVYVCAKHTYENFVKTFIISIFEQ